MNILTLKAVSLILWSHALVLAVIWFRIVGAEEKSTHIGHFVSLMGVFVPGSSLCVLLVLAAGMLGLPSMIAVIYVVVPASLVIGLHLEVTHLRQTTQRIEARRLALTLGVAGSVLLWRGGL